ncbi:MAG: thermonuclease family protein [Anaerolineae bacterium]
MSEIKIFWDPTGMTLDVTGTNKFIRATDGDTPYISVSVRMLSIDAPEVHYPGNANPERQNENLAQLADWIEQGKAPINDDLAAYLHPRLATGEAGTLQKEQGEHSSTVFIQMLDEMLTKENGRKRSLFVRMAAQPFDAYGRLLAYLAPSYSRAEREQMSRWERASFNLLMIRAGWAAPFIIYPSIPRYSDLIMMQQAGREAYVGGRGIWAEPLTLAGYEFRMAVKLYKVTKRLEEGEALSFGEQYTWISRYVFDMTTREIFYPQDYFKIDPYNRIFIWPDDVKDAVGKLNLVPGDR